MLEGGGDTHSAAEFQLTASQLSDGTAHKEARQRQNLKQKQPFSGKTVC